MTTTAIVLGVVAIAIGFGGGAAFVDAVRSPQPHRTDLGLASAAMMVLAIAVVILVSRIPPP